MSKPANGPDLSVSKPEWAQYDGAPSVDKPCGVVRNPIWGGCASCTAKMVKVYAKCVQLMSGAMGFCVTLMSAFLTLFLLLDSLPKPVAHLSKVYLLAGDSAESGPVLGNDCLVEWSDGTRQKVLEYYCVKNGCKEPSCPAQHAAGGGSAGSAGSAVSTVIAVSTGSAVSEVSTVSAVGGDVVYVVGGKFRVEGEFSRVVTLGKRNDVWEVPPFIRMVLKVLLTDAREGGLTSEVIHETATKMYLEKYPEVKNNKGMKGSGVLARKALGQYFRYTDKNGNKIDHLLFQLVTKFGIKVPTYCLKKEIVKIEKGLQTSVD